MVITITIIIFTFIVSNLLIIIIFSQAPPRPAKLTVLSTPSLSTPFSSSAHHSSESLSSLCNSHHHRSPPITATTTLLTHSPNLILPRIYCSHSPSLRQYCLRLRKPKPPCSSAFFQLFHSVSVLLGLFCPFAMFAFDCVESNVS